MDDAFTYIIYLSLLFGILFLTSKFYTLTKIPSAINLTQNIKLSKRHVAALLLISFVVGFRYNVGVDWKGYKEIFENIKNNVNLYKVEWGYLFINKLVTSLGGGSEVMFFLIALLSWYFVFKSIPVALLPLALYFIFADELFFWSMNGVRQFVALGIFFYAIKYIIKRDFKTYFFIILFASLFHNTALILIPLYFVPFHKLYNQKYWTIAILISFLFANIPFFINGTERIVISISNYITVLSEYLRFFKSGQYQVQNLDIGFGYFFKLFVTFFILIFSKMIVKKHPETKIYFVLFFTGSIIFNLFFKMAPIMRLNVYFLNFRPLVLSLIIYKMWGIYKYRMLCIVFVFIYFILFLSMIYNSAELCSPFNFTFLH